MAGRDLSLKPRKVATRDNKLEVEVFNIDEIEDHFNENVAFIISQFDIADDLLKSNEKERAADIWRSQLVFLDSAFDFFMHEIVKLGILNIFHEEWPKKSEQYTNLQFTMKNVEHAIKNPGDDSWLKDWVTEKYSSETLMSYDTFKGVCNLLSIDYRAIADSAFYERGSTEKTLDKLQRRINQLFYRRNRIAHQMDRNRENAERQNIQKEDVINFIDDIKKIVHATSVKIRQIC